MQDECHKWTYSNVWPDIPWVSQSSEVRAYNWCRKGQRFNFCSGNQIFLFVPRLWHNQHYFDFILLPNLTCTIFIYLSKFGVQLFLPSGQEIVLTISWEWYCSNGSTVRLHLHDHFHFSQIKYPDSAITVASYTVWRLNCCLSRWRLWVDSGYCLSFICDWLGGSSCRNWTEGHTITGLKKIVNTTRLIQFTVHVLWEIVATTQKLS